MSVKESLIELPAQYSSAVFGQLDEYAKKIEKTLKVTIIARDSDVKVIGAEGAVKKAAGVLNNLIELARRGNQITEQNVDYAISLVFEDQEEGIVEIDRDLICHTLQGKPIKPKTLGQKKYVDSIREGMITFGLGPAGTGKTYYVNALAVAALKQFKEVRYYSASKLLLELSAHEQVDDSLKFLGIMENIAQVDLLIIDDFGLMNLDVEKCRHLFEILDSRESRKSTVIVSQIPVKEWYDLFKNCIYIDAF